MMGNSNICYPSEDYIVCVFTVVQTDLIEKPISKGVIVFLHSYKISNITSCGPGYLHICVSFNSFIDHVYDVYISSLLWCATSSRIKQGKCIISKQTMGGYIMFINFIIAYFCSMSRPGLFFLIDLILYLSFLRAQNYKVFYLKFS